MADDILDEMEDDFDDSMADILDEPLEEVLEDKKEAAKKPSENKIVSVIKGFLQKNLGSVKAVVISSIVLILVMVITWAVWFFVFRASPEKILQPQTDVVQGDIQAGPAQEPEIIFEDIVEFEPFELIGLKTSSTKGSVSMNLAFELTDSRYRKQIYAMEDRIRTIVIQQVEQATWMELRNPEGKIMLKYNLLKRINAIFPKATVRNIYFTHFIMQ